MTRKSILKLVRRGFVIGIIIVFVVMGLTIRNLKDKNEPLLQKEDIFTIGKQTFLVWNIQTAQDEDSYYLVVLTQIDSIKSTVSFVTIPVISMDAIAKECNMLNKEAVASFFGVKTKNQ